MWSLLDGDVILGLIAVICVCLPCRWDPAILMKEILDDWPKEKRGGYKSSKGSASNRRL
jgi:hypothetical protein